MNNQEFFLATTALEDFWDTTKPVIFLGDWCLRYCRKSAWENLNAKTLVSPLSDFEKFREASQYADGLYERLLPVLAERLNELHDEHLTVKSWRIILGHWLNCCIFTLYDRYQVVRNALDKYPNITTIGLSDGILLIPKDTTDYFSLCASDLYNLQLFTRLLAEEGLDFPKREFNNSFQKIENIKNHHRNTLRKSIIGLFKFSQFLLQYRSPIILHQPFFPLPTIIKLFCKTKGRVVELNLPINNKIKYIVNPDMRNKLRDLFFLKNDFEKIFMLMLPELIPISFIENYPYFKSIVQKRYPQNTKVIFSSVAWSGDEAFKIWAAYMSNKGTKLIGAQHGGNYGSEDYFFYENHEVTITDSYHTWGWNIDNCHAKVIPGPANKLTGTRALGINKDEDSILFLSVSVPRYSDRMGHVIFYHFNEYFNYQMRFIAALGNELRKRLRVRLFVDDPGWSCVEQWSKEYPEVGIERWNIKFADSVQRSRICINDALSTTFLEILSWNKPTIFFWSNKLYALRKEAEPFYDDLRAAGILYNNPEEAAAALRNIYSDVETWWNEPQRQKIVRKFCHQFARTSPDALKYWVNEFNDILKEVRPKHIKK